RGAPREHRRAHPPGGCVRQARQPVRAGGRPGDRGAGHAGALLGQAAPAPLVLRGGEPRARRRAAAAPAGRARRPPRAAAPLRARTLRRARMRRAALAGLLLALLFFVALPALTDAALNRVTGPPVRPSERARELFAGLRVVDLHADALLWQRDLAQRGRGQV